MRREIRAGLLVAVLTVMCSLQTHAQDKLIIIHRNAWDFDRSVLEWYKWGNKEKAKKDGHLDAVAGWVEYDFYVPVSGWYELWQIGVPTGWTRDIFLDRAIIARLHTTDNYLDRITKGKRRGWSKEFNLYLEKGKHSLRYRRLGFPACMPGQWELIQSTGPLGCLRVKAAGQNVLRAGEKVKLQVTGGMKDDAASYNLVVQDTKTKKITPVGKVNFPASKTPITKTLEVTFPSQGEFMVLEKYGDALSRPSDLNAGLITAIDTKHAPVPSKELKKTLIVDIDCTADRDKGFWEKDGKTTVVEASFGKYRESSGNASNDHWALDGFSYSFDLPDTQHLYQLQVQYPDNDRRTMGFWLNDGVKLGGKDGVTLCGGVETGDRYRLTDKFQTHEAFFYPRNNKELVIAVVNLARGCRAAASRIRIYRIDGNLPAAPITAKRGRMMGYFFEENGRWLRHFGGDKQVGTIPTMERWGQWCRYIGANLMFPTINVYQGNHYPSNILEGYFNTSYDECRMNALVAEKYGCNYIPEFHLSGQTWFEKHVMGVWVENRRNKKWEKKQGVEKKEDEPKPVVMFRDKTAEEYVMRNMDGGYHCSWKPFIYNALHPKIQEKYIAVFGELADRLADTESFAGISSRLMLSWQWMGWNALPGLKWGYGDWTIAQFEKDTGIKVPGKAGKEDRFRKRYQFLTGPKREQWLKWRCDRMLSYYRRLRDRIQQAKPTAKLILTWHGPDSRAVISKTQLGQLEECGIRWQDFVYEPGILIVPGIVYGRRYSTPVLDAVKEDRLYDEDFKKLCRLGDRGVMLYSDYFEVNKNLKWDELGGKPYCAFDCCVPSGVNERELYALALADSDCSFIANGGNGWFFGTPKILTPFLKEYRALPAKPFRRALRFSPTESVTSVQEHDLFTDPVAVWEFQDKNTYFFYAVNRLPFPVKVSIELANAGKVISASTGEEIGKSWLGLGSTITVELPAFMLKSFKVDGDNIGIRDVNVDLPQEEIDKLKPMIAFAKNLLDDLENRRIGIELSKPDAEKAIKQLSEAVRAFEEKRYWQAKGDLRRANMVRIYDMTGKYPPGLHDRKVTRDYVKAENAPNLVSRGEKDIIGDVRGRLSSITDLRLDKKGNLYAASPEQLMEFSPDGKYVRSYRLVMPHTPDKGGVRWGGLEAPRYQPVDSVQLLDGDRIAVLCYNQPLYIYDLQTSRLVPQTNGSGFQMPGDRHRQLAMDSKGNIYIGCYGPSSKFGVWKFSQDGNPVYDFTTANGERTYRLCDVPAMGLAIDASDRIYVGYKDKIMIYSPAGRLLDTIEGVKLSQGIGALAITPDGKNLFASSVRGGNLVHFTLGSDGKFGKPKRVEGATQTVTALLVNQSGNRLLVGFDSPVKGAVVSAYPITAEGLGKPTSLIMGLSEEPNCLNGFSQIKRFKGSLYFLNGNKLMTIKPGANQAKLAHNFDPLRAKIGSFAFKPNGDLYLSSNNGLFRHSRGTNVYLAKKTDQGWAKPEVINGGKPLVDNPYYQPTDLACDAKGNLYIRHFSKLERNSNFLSVYTYSPDGAIERFCAMGPHRHNAPRIYGLHIDDKTGNVYVAGGVTRSIACFAPDGKQLWEATYKKPQGPGSLPIRNPIGITTDSQGDVWVTDPSANQILCFDKDGRFLRTYGSFGTIDDRDAKSFCFPVGVATAKDDTGQEWLYVTDVNNQRIKKFRINH